MVNVRIDGFYELNTRTGIQNIERRSRMLEAYNRTNLVDEVVLARLKSPSLFQVACPPSHWLSVQGKRK